MVSTAIQDVIRAAASAQRVLSLLRAQDLAKAKDMNLPGKYEANGIKGSLKFSNVSFSYPSRPGVPVLSNFSTEFPEGEITAIIGPSGSGKSTVLALLERWYDPDEGEVLLDDMDIRRYSLHSLRSHIGFVQQVSLGYLD